RVNTDLRLRLVELPDRLLDKAIILCTRVDQQRIRGNVGRDLDPFQSPLASPRACRTAGIENASGPTPPSPPHPPPRPPPPPPPTHAPRPRRPRPCRNSPRSLIATRR